MPFSRALCLPRPVVRFFCRLASAALLIPAAVAGLSAHAQVTGPTTPSASTSDVQTAQIADRPQDTDKRDIAGSVFGQLANKTNGNFVRLDPNSSAGGMVSFRQSPRWYGGYEVNYGFTSYSDSYSKGQYRATHAANELTLAWLLKAPAYRGLRGFLSFGGGLMVFSPSSPAGALLPPGTKISTQTLPLFVFSLGADHNLGQHLGVRFQLRTDTYKAPDFSQIELNAHKLRTTYEPALGVYYRF